MTPLTVVLPCYNEAERLPRTLEGLLAQLPSDVEVLVVDDGSTDATAAAARAAAGDDPRVRVILGPVNRGKGHAVRTGMLEAAGERIVFTDADGSYGAADVLRVAEALGEAPVAIGTRGQAAGAGSPVRRLASRLFNRAVRELLELPFDDTQCGLKGFCRAAAQDVFGRAQVDGFAFDAEALALARRLDHQVREVPVTAEERHGSKIRLATDALRMLRDMWRVRRRLTREAGVPAVDG